MIVQLTEDFVRLDLIYSHKSKTEYHVFPVRKASEKVVTRKDEQLNVIMVMFDSISRSDAQRYMNRTYGMLEKDADSVILKVRKRKKYLLNLLRTTSSPGLFTLIAIKIF